MKMSLAISLASLIGAIVAGSSGMALAQTSSVPHELRICTGDFALCAASTCALDGNKIAVNNTTTLFDESQCTCPIFTGPAIADVIGGNMTGSCQPPPNNGVWSLYELNSQIPQAINDWKKNGPKAEAPAFICTGSDVVFSNCWSFACVRAGEIKGVPVATCFCATQESPEAQPVPVGTQFITQAGQCAISDPSVCTQFPIGAPFQVDDIPPPACFPIPEEQLSK
jgi:hypothetical protein